MQAFLQAVDRYNENGRFSQSAKIHKEIAELYEASHDEESAMTHYQQAGDLYDNDNKKQSANPMFLKVATIAALKEDFSRAAGIYEKIGRESLDSNLGKYAAKVLGCFCLYACLQLFFNCWNRHLSSCELPGSFS